MRERDIARDMKTIMVGSLAAIEDAFGFSWGLDDIPGYITPEDVDALRRLEPVFAGRWAALRTRILDEGHARIDRVAAQLSRNHG